MKHVIPLNGIALRPERRCKRLLGAVRPNHFRMSQPVVITLAITGALPERGAMRPNCWM